MGLTEEERRKIYEEEKAREDARRQIQAERQRIYEEEKMRLEGTQAQPAPTSTLGTQSQQQVINSGSWGAGGFGFIYLLSMKAYTHAIVSFVLSLIPIVNIVVFVYYVINGKRLAWANRQWQGFDDFLSCQRIWDRWAKWWFGILVVSAILYAVSAVPQ
jgi:hypothetical protein